MGEYGFKIKNYDAADVYGYNLGIRDKYTTKDAMLVNSLFLDFLLENGLKTHKDESTRDIICIEFFKQHGVRNFQSELLHLDKMENKLIKNKEKLSEEEINRKKEIIEYFRKLAYENKDKFEDRNLNGDDLRVIFYTKGVDIQYPVWKRGHGGKITIDGYESIHYKMLYRTPGKAKKGSCMFIREELYDKAHEFLWMGLELPYENAPIVEIGAYSSLITSSIVGRVHIDPDEILVIKDVDSFFETSVISVETDEDRNCISRKLDNYKLKNTMFDGQALIDSSIFPDWGDGYVLLRHHFCKMAAFKTHIQKFFHEMLGNAYDTTYLTDIFGIKHKASQIKLITTENALKWLKFDVGYEYWSEWVRKNGSMFGIVKTAHPSKLGNVQRMSYQMVNALDINTVDKILEASLNYVNALQTDTEIFLDYLEKNKNFSNDFEVLIELVRHNPDFVYCNYFKERRATIIKNYTINLKTGRIIQNGDNLVIVGSPYAMLLASIGKDPFKDPTFTQENGVIQCWTARFKDKEYLAEFRNPFNGRSNLGILRNHYHEYFDRYFDLGELIIAVNMNGTDFQDRNNGSDQDSDSLYVTNQPQIVNHAKWCYEKYPTIVNNIPKEKNTYTNTLYNFARIDNSLAAAQIAIGSSSNLAQICLTYSYNFDDPKYESYVSILSVVAQAAIDNAKRKYDIDLVKVINDIKKDMEVTKYKYPAFWQIIRRDFNKNRINYDLKCPMNEIYNIKIKRNFYRRTIPIKDFFTPYEKLPKMQSKPYKVDKMITKYMEQLMENRIQIRLNENDDTNDVYYLMEENFDKLVKDIKELYPSKKECEILFRWILNRCFNINTKKSAKVSKNRSVLMKILYDVNKTVLLSHFIKA